MNKRELIVQIEQSFLGAILKDPTLIDETRIRSEHLTIPEHQILFNCMQAFKKQGKKITIINLGRLGESKTMQFGGVKYLSKLLETVPSVHGFKSYEKGILDFWATEEGQMYCNEFLQKAKETFSPDDLRELIQNVSRLEERTVSKGKSFQEQLNARYQEHINSPAKGLSGTDTGFMSLNNLTDGWQRSELIVIGARPSMGKTAFILNSMLNATRKKDVMVTFFSVEMDEGSIIDRFIAAQGKINLAKMRNPNKNFNENEWERHSKAIGQLESLNIDIRMEKTVPEMRAIMRRNVKKHPDKKHAVYIDFLTMIRSTNHYNNRHLEVEEIVSDLKQIAKDFKVPIILLAQLSRSIEQRQDKHPMMSDLRESGSIEQTADTVMFLYREEYYNPDTENRLTELIVAKNRNGPVGKLEFRFFKETNVFSEVI